MEQRLSVITLGVADLERSRAFYEALGWRTGAQPGDDVVFFLANGVVIALWDRARLAEDSGVEDAGGWGGVTLAYNVRSPAEADSVLDAARSAGATIARSGAETFWAATPASSSTRTATLGRWPTTPAGRSARTGRSSASADPAYDGRSPGSRSSASELMQ